MSKLRFMKTLVICVFSSKAPSGFPDRFVLFSVKFHVICHCCEIQTVTIFVIDK